MEIFFFNIWTTISRLKTLIVFINELILSYILHSPSWTMNEICLAASLATATHVAKEEAGHNLLNLHFLFTRLTTSL